LIKIPNKNYYYAVLFIPDQVYANGLEGTSRRDRTIKRKGIRGQKISILNGTGERLRRDDNKKPAIKPGRG
jgi:hypothetical protein